MQRHATLSQVEELYAKIEQAADQVTLVRVMEGSTGVLRDLQKQAGGIEKVEDVVEGLREEMTKVDEVGAVLNEAGTTAALADEEELDEELKAMEKQQKEEKEHEEQARKEEWGRHEFEETKCKEDERADQEEELEKRATRFALVSQGKRGKDEKQDVDELIGSTSGLSVDDEERGRIPVTEQ